MCKIMDKPLVAYCPNCPAQSPKCMHSVTFSKDVLRAGLQSWQGLMFDTTGLDPI